MGPDLYKLSRELAKELTDLGYENISEEIENLISGGSTGTEILMGLRWKFSQFLENKKSDLPKELRTEINKLINLISETLDM
jgi:hypothetical protein